MATVNGFSNGVIGHDKMQGIAMRLRSNANLALSLRVLVVLKFQNSRRYGPNAVKPKLCVAGQFLRNEPYRYHGETVSKSRCYPSEVP